MSMIKVTTARRKVLEFLEVSPSYRRNNYANFSSIEECLNFCRENSIDLSERRLAISYGGDVITESAIVPVDHEDPVENIFNSADEAERFIEMQGYSHSIHLTSGLIQDEVSSFFNGSDCHFEGWETMREEYKEELNKMGGEECPDCTKSSIMRKYQDKIISFLEEPYDDELDSKEESKNKKDKKEKK